MSSDQIFVGLEIGTTKICVVVAEAKSEEQISILGVGETPSRGIRKGEIVDMVSATQCVREAILDAEDKTNVEIGNVWVAITGGHLQSINNRSIHVLPHARQIVQSDLDQVQANAKELSIPSQNIFLHTILQSYHLDGNRNVIDPLDSEGTQLEADFHVVHGIKTRIHNTLRCVESLKLEIEDVVLSSLASAQVVVTQHQKDLGVMVIDIGGGTTDYIVYQDGAVRHSGVLAVGGDHITNDISLGLKLPIKEAEALKISEGSATDPESSPGGVITLRNDPGFLGCDIDRRSLETIIHSRVREIFELVRDDLRRNAGDYLPILGAGIVITGGSARLPGIAVVAAEVLDQPAQVTTARNVGGPLQTFENPQFSTAIGLAKYARLVTRDLRPEGALGGMFKVLGGLFGRRGS